MKMSSMHVDVSKYDLIQHIQLTKNRTSASMLSVDGIFTWPLKSLRNIIINNTGEVRTSLVNKQFTSWKVQDFAQRYGLALDSAVWSYNIDFCCCY